MFFPDQVDYVDRLALSVTIFGQDTPAPAGVSPGAATTVAWPGASLGPKWNIMKYPKLRMKSMLTLESCWSHVESLLAKKNSHQRPQQVWATETPCLHAGTGSRAKALWWALGFVWLILGGILCHVCDTSLWWYVEFFHPQKSLFNIYIYDGCCNARPIYFLGVSCK